MSTSPLEDAKEVQQQALNLETFSQQGPITLKSNRYLERQNQLESNARSYPRSFPIAIQRAQGVYIEDTDGQLFIDCLAGAGTLALGHNHPAIHEVLKQHLDSGAPLHTLDITTPAKDAFIEALYKALPADFAKDAKVQFCGPTGADAVEAAIKLVKTATQRGGVIAFSGAYHGMTHGTLAMMGNLATKTPVKNLMPDVQFLPFPNPYRCPLGLTGEHSVEAHLAYLESVFSDPQSGVPLPAAVIVEAIQGEGGVVTAPVAWLKGLRAITEKYNVPLIFDEVQSGIGKSGKMFAFEHADIVPDAIVISKAIGGGLPLSLVVYHERLDKWAPGAHTGTFRGNQLAMAAGTKTLEVIESQGLIQHAEHMGSLLRRKLEALQDRCAYIGNIRGKGLMLGVEIVDADNHSVTPPPPPFGELASAIKRLCLSNGLIIESGGKDGCTLRFLAPLIITEQEIDKVAAIFEKSVLTAVDHLKSAQAITTKSLNRQQNES